MEPRRLVVYSVVAVVVAVTLASGPLVGAVDLTEEADDGITEELGEGSADVELHVFPEEVTLSEGRYGSEQYYLRVPDASYTLSNVTGQPIVVYSVTLEGPETYSSGSKNSFVTAENEGRRIISIDEKVFDRDELRPGRYNATVTLLVRGDGEQTIETETFTVEVEP